MARRESTHGIYEATSSELELISPEDKAKLDILGTLTTAMLARLTVVLTGGETGQVLSVKADGTLEWKTLE